MRSLKFRAWNKKGKCWITFGGVNYRYENGTLDIVDSDNLIYEQSTGLKDKNGKEIYEGDIVSKDSLSGEYGTLFVVKYGGSYDIDIGGHHYCPFIRGFYLDEMCEYDKVDEDGYMEVIGNVHEDKELLGGEE